MPSHRPFLWAVSLAVLITLLLVLGWDSVGCIARLHTPRLSTLGGSMSASNEHFTQRPASPRLPLHADEHLCEDEGDSSDGGHVQRVAVDRVSAAQPNVSFVESLVPTLAELSEEAWADVSVPSGLLYFLEIRTSKLISIAQLIRADPSLSTEDRRRLMQRLVVNYHAVTRVGEKLCGAIDDYVDRVASRRSAAEKDAAQHGHDLEEEFLQRRDEDAMGNAQVSVLQDLVTRNPGWREAVRVCRVLNSKLEHFMPVINALLNDSAESLL